VPLDPIKGAKGMSAFILPRNAPGFAIGAAGHRLGIRNSSTGKLLRDVPVTHAQRLGNEGDGMAIAMKTLDMARPAIATLAVGLAQRCLDECLAHLHWHFPAGSFPDRRCSSGWPTGR